jgi:hypothetical protein
MTVQKFTLIGTVNNPITGLPVEEGYVLVAPSTDLVDTVGEVVFPRIGYQVPVVNGVLTPTLIPYTDNAGIIPSGWILNFTHRFPGAAELAYSSFVTSDMGPTVNLADLVKVSNPPAVVVYIVTGHPMTVSGVPGVDDVLTAVSSTEATWQPAQGGGGGGAVTTVFTRSGDVVALKGDYSSFYDALGSANSAITSAANYTNNQISALGLGTASQHDTGYFDLADSATSAQTAAISASTTNTTNAITALNLGTKSQQSAGNAIGLLAEVLPIYNCVQAGGSTLTAGFQICNLIRPDGPITATNLGIWITLAGVTASGYNGLGLFTEAGVLIDQTADMSAQFATLGYVEAPMGAAHSLAANTSYYICVISHFSGTAPKAGSSIAGLTIPLIKGHYFSLSKSAIATFPNNFTPSTYATSTASYYMGIS